MATNLQILQLNVRKRDVVQLSMMNDRDFAGLCSTGGSRAIRAEHRWDADGDTESPQELDEIRTIKETRDAVTDPEYALDTQRSRD